MRDFAVAAFARMRACRTKTRILANAATAKSRTLIIGSPHDRLPQSSRCAGRRHLHPLPERHLCRLLHAFAGDQPLSGVLAGAGRSRGPSARSGGLGAGRPGAVRPGLAAALRRAAPAQGQHRKRLRIATSRVHEPSMSTNTPIDLRPRTPGEILDDAWRLALADAPLLLALSGLFAGRPPSRCWCSCSPCRCRIASSSAASCRVWPRCSCR